MQTWGRALASLLVDGFQVQGSKWRVVILGFTGDSPFVKKVGAMNRSFNNVRKTASSKNVQKGCCWLCHAGHDVPQENLRIPFEHLGFLEPAWLQTTKLGAGCALLQYMPTDAFHIFMPVSPRTLPLALSSIP